MGANTGTFIMLKLNNKLLFGQNSASLKDSITMIEISNKTTGNSSAFVPGRSNTTMSVGGIGTSTPETLTMGFHELRSAALAGTLLPIIFAEFTTKGAEVQVTGSVIYTGNAYISNVTREEPDNDKSTYSCDLQVTGDLIAAVAPGTIPPPTGSSAQILETGDTVADLVAVGLLVEWFAAASGGAALAASTALVTDTHYYAEQTIGGVKSSTRLDVHVALV